MMVSEQVVEIAMLAHGNAGRTGIIVFGDDSVGQFISTASYQKTSLA